jgi:hypothetical protein
MRTRPSADEPETPHHFAGAIRPLVDRALGRKSRCRNIKRHVFVRIAKIAKPTGSKLVKGPAESEKFVQWKSMKNSEENS